MAKVNENTTPNMMALVPDITGEADASVDEDAPVEIVGAGLPIAYICPVVDPMTSTPSDRTTGDDVK